MPQNDAQAAAWYRKAAEQGHAEAQFTLGGMYYEGEGVTRDYGQAAAWFRKAAEQGDARAQFTLGGMYYEGKGVPQDDEASYGWYARVAAQDGRRHAALMRDELEKKLTPEQIARVQKMLSEQAKPAPQTP